MVEQHFKGFSVTALDHQRQAIFAKKVLIRHFSEPRFHRIAHSISNPLTHKQPNSPTIWTPQSSVALIVLQLLAR